MEAPRERDKVGVRRHEALEYVISSRSIDKRSERKEKSVQVHFFFFYLRHVRVIYRGFLINSFAPLWD